LDDRFDVAVIGAGPAGEKAAVRAAYFGKRVALVEQEERFGGACGKGGLASKILRESALLYRGAARRLADVLQPVPQQRLEMANFLRAVDRVCDAHYQGVRESIERHHIEWARGTARFLDPHRLAVAGAAGTRTIAAEVIVIATGSRPSQPDFVPWGAPGVYHADTLLGMRELPRRLAVVGGGVIGVELGSIFAALDVDVCIIEQRPQILEFLDDDVSAHLVEELAARGARLHLGEQVTECRAGDGGVRVVTDAGTTIDAEAVLFAGGRLANTDGLGLEAIGIAVGRLGRPVVDEHFRTAQPHVYAVGDVIGFPALASTAMEQGRVAVGHALRAELAGRSDALPFEASLPYPLLPYGLYTIPSVAMVGKTEAQLRAAGTRYVAGVAGYGRNARGHLIGDTGGRLKLLADPRTRRVLGVHIVGETAEELVHLGQACMHFDGTIDYFLRSVFNFPTLASLYKSASYEILQRLGHVNPG
jgi:NAD(P) transhydrogenase